MGETIVLPPIGMGAFAVNNAPYDRWIFSVAMPRQPRELKTDYCYHITMRCNNRDFRLNRFECKELLLYVIERCRTKLWFQAVRAVYYEQPRSLPAGTAAARRFAQNYALAELVFGNEL